MNCSPPGAYEANKELTLLNHPALSVEVWVDEVDGLAVADAERLARELPGRVRLEREDRVLTHCWVRWERKANLSLAGGGERCYQLDPYAGTVTFGDGVHGRVPPSGGRRISGCPTASAGESGATAPRGRCPS